MPEPRGSGKGRRRDPSGGPLAPTPRSVEPTVPPVSSELPDPAALAQELMREPIRGPIRIVFLDLDGTLTDGVIGFDAAGDSRNFWIRDGLALQWAKQLGVKSVVISGRGSAAAEARMRELGLEHYLGVQDKVAVAEQVLARERAEWAQCVMVGDDLPDVPMMKRVGWPMAVADATPEARAVARTVLGHGGGRGAVREVVEMVLKHNGVWDDVLRRYEAM